MCDRKETSASTEALGLGILEQEGRALGRVIDLEHGIPILVLLNGSGFRILSWRSESRGAKTDRGKRTELTKGVQWAGDVSKKESIYWWFGFHLHPFWRFKGLYCLISRSAVRILCHLTMTTFVRVQARTWIFKYWRRCRKSSTWAKIGSCLFSQVFLGNHGILHLCVSSARYWPQACVLIEGHRGFNFDWVYDSQIQIGRKVHIVILQEPEYEDLLLPSVWFMCRRTQYSCPLSFQGRAFLLICSDG